MKIKFIFLLTLIFSQGLKAQVSATMPTIGGPVQICSSDNSLQTYTILSGDLNDNTQWSWYVSGFSVGTGTSIQLQTNYPITVRGEGGSTAPGAYGTIVPNIVPGPTAVITLTTPSTCGLSNAVLSGVNSINAVSYSWSDGVNPPGGNIFSELTGANPSYPYFLTVTSANGCTHTIYDVVNNSNATPDAFIEYTSNPFLLQVTNQVYTTYQWMLNNVDILGANSTAFIPTQNGDYSVVVSINNCEASSNIFTVSTLSLEFVNDLNLSVFPNPTNEYFQISGENITDITLIDGSGRIVISQVNYNGEEISVDHLAKGVYTLNFFVNQNAKQSKLIVE